MRRRSLLLGLPLALAAIPARAEDRVLQVVSPWEISSLDPSDTGYVAARIGVAEPLTGVEPDGRIVGLVAESWTVSEDGLTWRFRIRPGLRFHDGSAVTPEAAVASFERGRTNAETLSTLPIASVTADGDALVIRTTAPFAPLPSFLTDYSGIILAPSSYGADGKVVAWIGTGPYKVTRVDGDRVIDLEAADTARAKSAIARVRYTAASLGETRSAMVQAGDADVAFTLAPASVAQVNAGRRAHVQSLTIPRVNMLAFNVGLPMFAGVRARRAISIAIDRAGIAAAILRNPASAANQLFPPMLADWHLRDQPPIGRDPQQAKSLLSEAGWQPGPDGILLRGAQPFRFTVLVPSNRPDLPPMAAAMQGQLREVGIDMQIKVAPFGAIPQAHKDGSLEAALLARTYVNVPDPIGTVIPDFTRPKTVWASDGWHSDEMDRLVAAYVGTFDPVRLPELRREIASVIQAELPIVPVSWYDHTVAVSNRVTGMQIDPYEQRYLIERMRWAD